MLTHNAASVRTARLVVTDGKTPLMSAIRVAGSLRGSTTAAATGSLPALRDRVLFAVILRGLRARRHACADFEDGRESAGLAPPHRPPA
jgi:hypothetical protein